MAVAIEGKKDTLIGGLCRDSQAVIRNCEVCAHQLFLATWRWLALSLFLPMAKFLTAASEPVLDDEKTNHNNDHLRTAVKATASLDGEGNVNRSVAPTTTSGRAPWRDAGLNKPLPPHIDANIDEEELQECFARVVASVNNSHQAHVFLRRSDVLELVRGLVQCDSPDLRNRLRMMEFGSPSQPSGGNRYVEDSDDDRSITSAEDEPEEEFSVSSNASSDTADDFFTAQQSSRISMDTLHVETREEGRKEVGLESNTRRARLKLSKAGGQLDKFAEYWQT